VGDSAAILKSPKVVGEVISMACTATTRSARTLDHRMDVEWEPERAQPSIDE
jgi:hypothetical protein